MFFRRANRDQSKKPDETATPLAPEGRDEAGEAAAADPSAASAAVSESERETRVPTEKLRPRVDPSRLPFKTTADLEPASGLIGQDRALKAIAFGAGVKARDFNIFVLGPPASGKSTAVRAYLEAEAASAATPSDWVYVNNFETPNKPRAIRLPPGRAAGLSKSMIAAIDELRASLPAVFMSEDYLVRRRSIEEELRGTQEELIETFTQKAGAQNIAVLRTPMGFAMAPMLEGKVVKPEVFEALPANLRRDVEVKIGELQKELEQILAQGPRLEKGRRQKLSDLNEEFARRVLRAALDDVEAAHHDLPDVLAFLAAAEADLVRNVELFLAPPGDEPTVVAVQPDTARDPRFRRYMINVLVGRETTDKGAPVIEADNPSHGHLIGRVEHIAHMGALLTDFLLIKPGALHKANGGSVLLDARKLLTTPFVWDALKRALKSGEIRLDSPVEAMGFQSTQTLDPDPIPLEVKVVLFGDRELYYLLAAYDPDFPRLFKVQADFDDTIARSENNELAYARLIASIVETHKLKPLDNRAVARLIEEGARLAADNEKLSIEIGRLADIVREADYWAGVAGRQTIGREDVRRAIDEHVQRSDRLSDRAQEAIGRGIVLVDTAGSKVGQINGLSVIQLGDFAFGRPSRITARVRMGAGRVTDIEREAKLGGALHSKGVMILWGFLAGRYAEEVPLALAASLVFEQSYGGVDGDSASSAELYAILSALSDLPIRQGLAVTGSVNQWGEVQAIGGVNEKIEGFFDICKARGLDGTQGVLIPEANVQHLMLREDVVEAVAAGEFRVHAVATIDEGIALLTGVKAGERGADGRFPSGSVNRRVEDKLVQFAERARRFGRDGKDSAADSKVTS